MIEDVDLLNNFKEQFSDERLKYISQNKTVIVMSHYPLFASRPEHAKSKGARGKLISVYQAYFNSMGLDLYLAGHQHLYERLRPICL